MLSGMRTLGGLALSSATGRAASAGAGMRGCGGHGEVIFEECAGAGCCEREAGDIGEEELQHVRQRLRPASHRRRRTTARSRSGRRPRPSPIHALRAGVGARAGGGVGTSAWRGCGWFARDGCAVVVERAGGMGASAHEVFGAAG